MSPTAAPPTPPTPPTAALRTYRFLRFAVVIVIGLLAASVLRETFRADPDCLQGSISAYYYTSVRSVFVGALVVLGFAMIVLWGKSAWEDALFNLAGLLAPVVAFVPTGDTTKCLLTDPAGKQVTKDAVEQKVIDASHAAVDNNMLAYLVITGAVLLGLLVIGLLAQFVKEEWSSLVENGKAFWIPWVLAAALWSVGFWLNHQKGHARLYDKTHTPSAIIMFVFIVGAIIAIGFDKHRGHPKINVAAAPGWARIYWGLAGIMIVGAGAILLWPDSWASADFFDHQTFWLEAYMILWVAVFWVLQTIDRWNDGAPPRTKAEVEERETYAAAQEG